MKKEHSVFITKNDQLTADSKDKTGGRDRNRIASWSMYLFWFAVSFLLMLFLTRSSFLYPYNNWDDSNSYFSMGKSMFHGTLIYRDLFDQKGPYLYFLYGICSLISGTDFRGVFLMEVLLGMFDLSLIDRIMTIWCSRRVSLVLTPVLFTCMCASKSFYWGGCAEEICLPFLLLTFCILLERLHSSLMNIFERKDVFYAGLCCGFVFCVKFTLMGFFLGFVLVVILSCRSWREFLRLAAWFLLGFFIPFVPWLVYFGIRGGLDDWYRVYIYTNVFQYSNFGANSHGESMPERIYALAKILYWLVLDNIQYFAFIIIGLVWILLLPSARVLLRIAPVLLFALTFLFIYVGGAHLPYYALPLTVFSVTGAAAVGSLADRILRMASARSSRITRASSASRQVIHRTSYPQQDPMEVSDLQQNTSTSPHESGKASISQHSSQKASISQRTPSGNIAVMIPAFIISFAVSFLIYWNFSWNRYYLSYTKEDVFLSAFTEDINRDRSAGIVDPDNTTLLNVGCLDCGLYTTTGIYPTCYWFQTQTLPGNEVINTQVSYMAEAATDYVVVRGEIPRTLSDHYEEIDHFHQKMGSEEFDYYLFRRKSSPGK